MMARQNRILDINVIFWQQWPKHRNYLYGCCLNWMGGNPTDAEYVLSEAMVKAIEKLRTTDRPISNFKAWLTRLTYNLCMDIRRQRRRNPVQSMDLEAIASAKNDGVTQKETPDPENLRELELFLADAIDNLPPRMRETFQLYLQRNTQLSNKTLNRYAPYCNGGNSTNSCSTIVTRLPMMGEKSLSVNCSSQATVNPEIATSKSFGGAATWEKDWELTLKTVEIETSLSVLSEGKVKTYGRGLGEGALIPLNGNDYAALKALYQSTNGPSWNNNKGWKDWDFNSEELPDASAVSGWYGVTIEGDRVTNLSLNHNQLTGSIPTELGHLTNLSYLSLNYNQLTGSIPTELGHLTNLSYLSLNHNQLTGSIPTELGHLTNLSYLSLNHNQLTGSIPTELGHLTKLSSLGLNHNQLTGSIPTELGHLTNLSYLSLNYNQLTGSIPTELGHLTNLSYLYLYHNQLTGSIPAELGNLTKLSSLYLNNNQLTGSIPAELGNLTKLSRLYLDHNQLTGFIPAVLTVCRHLKC